MMPDDMELVREYARKNSEAAFAALVSRHINLVYTVALRQVRDAHLAEEITQAVFVILARKAGSLGAKTILAGWLCRTARYASANVLTMQRRRKLREQEAHMQSTLNEPETDVWSQMAPLLDTALGQLGEKDHNAIVLRFFEGKDFREVGAALGFSEDAAKKRVRRALEKLRRFFLARGVVSTTAMIAGAISAHSTQAAPAALAKSVVAIGMAKGATASVSTLTLIKGALKIMAWTKAKTAIVAGVVVLLASGAATVTIQTVEAHKASKAASLGDSIWQVEQITKDSSTLESMPPLVRIVPTKFTRSGGSRGARGNKLAGLNRSLSDIILTAYGRTDKPARMILETDLPQGRYDFIASLPANSPKALQEQISKQFGLVARHETRQMEVLQLVVQNSNSASLTPTAAGPRSGWAENDGNWKDAPISGLAAALERMLNIPIIDQTGLTGRYNFSLKVKEKNWGPGISDVQKELLKQAVLNDLGLGLVPATMPLDVLVVGKAD